MRCSFSVICNTFGFNLNIKNKYLTQFWSRSLSEILTHTVPARWMSGNSQPQKRQSHASARIAAHSLTRSLAQKRRRDDSEWRDSTERRQLEEKKPCTAPVPSMSNSCPWLPSSVLDRNGAKSTKISLSRGATFSRARSSFVVML